MKSPNETRRLLRSLSIARSRPSVPPVRRVGGFAVLAAVGIGIIAGAGSVAWWQDDKVGTAHASARSPVAVPLAKPDRGATMTPIPVVGFVASGYVMAARRATVAAEVTGRIVSIEVKEGDRVIVGQVIARLDDTIARSDLAHAERQAAVNKAAIAVVENQWLQARRVRAQSRELFAQGFLSDAEVARVDSSAETLDREVQRARAEHEVALANVRRHQVLVQKHVIRAPFAGIVVDRSAQAGEVISPTSAGGSYTRTGLCTIIDAASVRIEVDINENQIGQVGTGQPVEITLPVPGEWPVAGRVLSIVPIANREKAALRVLVGIDRPDDRFIPNLSARIVFKSCRPSGGDSSATPCS